MAYGRQDTCVTCHMCHQSSLTSRIEQQNSNNYRLSVGEWQSHIFFSYLNVDTAEFAYWNSMTNSHEVTNAATGILFLDSRGEYR